MKKILFTVLPVLMLVLTIFFSFGSNVLATDNKETTSTTKTGVGTDFPDPGDSNIDAIDKLTNNVWGTVLTIAQILAFAAIIFAGVRYMFASADQKADIKKGLIYLVIGAILVFAASTLVKVIVNTAEQVSKDATSSKTIIVNEVNEA